MNTWNDLDLSKGKEKYAKAMVYRNHQGLKKELKNIDCEYSKALSTIRRDLEKTRDSLKALRISQKQVRRSSFSVGQRKHKQGMDFGSMPSRSLRRASTVPLRNDLSSKIVQRRQLSEATILHKMQSRKMLVKKLDGWRDEGDMEHRQGSVSQDAKQEMKGKHGRGRDLSDILSTIFTPLPALDGSEVDRDLETSIEAVHERDVARGLDSSGDDSVENSSILTIEQREESGNREPISPGDEDEAAAVEETSVEETSVEETSVEQSLGSSWSNDEACRKETLDRNSLFFPNEANISALSRGKHVRTRRASSPNIMFTTSNTELISNKPKTKEPNDDNGTIPRKKMLSRRGSSPNLLFTATANESTAEEARMNELHQDTRQRTRTRRASTPDLMFTATQKETEKQRLSSIHEKGNMLTSAPRQRSGRRSSIAVMTGVANSLGPKAPSPKSLVISLPELGEQSFGGLEKGHCNRRSCIVENNMHDSLRKISLRLNTPLTGAQLEKRLQARRVDASVTCPQNPRIACTPERKAPNALDMNDLEECRYIRRRTSK